MEKSYLMIKPGFLDFDLIKDVIARIEQCKELTIEDTDFIKYSKEDAKAHYINKKDKDYYNELTDYLSSNVAFGLVITGDNAIQDVCKLKDELRETLPKKYSCEITNMKNIIHSSDSLEASEREIILFYSVGKKQKQLFIG